MEIEEYYYPVINLLGDIVGYLPCETPEELNQWILFANSVGREQYQEIILSGERIVHIAKEIPE